jgi:hypothetical protein
MEFIDMKHLTIFILACAAVWTASAQEAKPSFPSVLPGNGLAQHDFFYAGEAKTQDMYIVRNGKVAWEFHDPSGKGEISDAILLSNGNVLFAHQFGIALIDPNKKKLWSYDAPAGTEIHTVQAIGTDKVLYVQNGDPAKVVVVNIVTGKTEREFAIPVKNPKVCTATSATSGSPMPARCWWRIWTFRRSSSTTRPARSYGRTRRARPHGRRSV